MSRRVSLATLFSIILIDSIGYSIIVPVLAPILLADAPKMMASSSSEMRYLMYGFALGLYDLVMLYAAPMLGEMSDQIGRKKVLVLTMVGVIGSYFLLAVSTTYGLVSVLLLARIIGGATAGGQAVAQAAVVDLSNAKNKAVLLSLCLLASSGGFIAGPALGAVLMNSKLVPWFDYTIPLYATALLGVISLLLLMASYKNERPATGRITRKTLDLGAGVRCLVDGWHHPRIRKLAIIFTLHQIAWGAYFLFMPSFLLKRFDFSETQIAIFLSVLGIGYCVAYGVVNPLLARWLSPKTMTAIGIWSTLALLIASFFTRDVELIWWIAIPIGTTVSVAYGALITMFSDSVGEAKQGWALGITISVTALAMGVVPVVSGVISSLHYSAPIVLGAVSMVASGIVLMTLRDTEPVTKV